MTSQRVKRLEEAGIDVAAALERMMGSEELLDAAAYEAFCTEEG